MKKIILILAIFAFITTGAVVFAGSDTFQNMKNNIKSHDTNCHQDNNADHGHNKDGHQGFVAKSSGLVRVSRHK